MKGTGRLKGTASLLQGHVLTDDINNIEPRLDFLNFIHGNRPRADTNTASGLVWGGQTGAGRSAEGIIDSLWYTHIIQHSRLREVSALVRRFSRNSFTELKLAARPKWSQCRRAPSRAAVASANWSVMPETKSATRRQSGSDATPNSVRMPSGSRIKWL